MDLMKNYLDARNEILEVIKAIGEEDIPFFSIAYESKAGDMVGRRIEGGEAVKILTGAPIPPGADCVIMYEKTEYTRESVTISCPLSSGENIIYAG